MISNPIKKIVIIGCGNVAWHLAEKLSREKNTEPSVYNHKANKELALFKNEFGIAVFPSLKKVIPDADVYFICVSDKNIASVIKTLSYLKPDSTLLITSASFNFTEANSKLKNLAIFYPIQTFSKEDQIKWKDTTIVIDANSKLAEQKAVSYALTFTKDLLNLNYEQRLKLHLSAVLVNNFTNSLYVEADKILRTIRGDLDVRLLLPLIKQGAKKLKRMPPKEAQTGPAKRKDDLVMQKHLAFTKNKKNLNQLYQLISSLIIEQQK